MPTACSIWPQVKHPIMNSDFNGHFLANSRGSVGPRVQSWTLCLFASVCISNITQFPGRIVYSLMLASNYLEC